MSVWQRATSDWCAFLGRHGISLLVTWGLIAIGLAVDFWWRGKAAALAEMTTHAIYGIVPAVVFLGGVWVYQLAAAPHRLVKERLAALEGGEQSASAESDRTLDDAERDYEQLGTAERDVVDAFVVAGGCALLWGELETYPQITITGVESLRAKGLLWESTTADLRETFVLDQFLFTVAQEHYESPF